MRVFITGMGVVSPLGCDTEQFLTAMESGRTAVRSLTVFRGKNALPVGEVEIEAEAGPEDRRLPRTHLLALKAAREAIEMAGGPNPDAVVLGGTTGGIIETERRLETGEHAKELFVHHGVGTVAELLAKETGCHGPVLTVSTACSSGGAAIVLALRLLRMGLARRVLAGGADSLCYLTYYGFNSLQLIDPAGARPFDRDRRGMNVAEGAGMLVLSASEQVPFNAVAEVLGGGLSCDAYHPAAPHPEGKGAEVAIREALSDAGISAADVDYISLHGTGTKDNDRSEAKALDAVFGDAKPPASSIKGAMGHSLAVAGAIEAVLSALAIDKGVVPSNTGLLTADPDFRLALVEKPARMPVRTVLSNSFGFGGNNATLVFGAPVGTRRKMPPVENRLSLRVDAGVCLTGAGDTEQTLSRLAQGISSAGTLSAEELSKGLPPKEVRRLKRLPRMALALSAMACERGKTPHNPKAVFWGTGWGSLSETYDFLKRLFESEHQFTSPTDFIGSVHNAPAGNVAIRYDAKGPNITATGGDCSFEQALVSACLLSDSHGGPFLVMGADEHHPLLTGLFDPSFGSGGRPSDGGGAIRAWPKDANLEKGFVRVSPLFFKKAGPSRMEELLEILEGANAVQRRFGGIFAGIPAACRQEGENGLKKFLSLSDFKGPVFDYRRHIGEFATASAVATALAVRCVQDGNTFAPLSSDLMASLNGRGILIVGFGTYITAIAAF